MGLYTTKFPNKGKLIYLAFYTGMDRKQGGGGQNAPLKFFQEIFSVPPNILVLSGMGEYLNLHMISPLESITEMSEKVS